MKDIFIVDRIEGKYIVVEDLNGDIIDIEKSLVESGVKEGDCLIKKGIHFLIDLEETKKRKEEISNLMKGMWAD